MDDLFGLLGAIGGATGNDALSGIAGAFGAVGAVISCIALVAGAIQCFFGYRIFRVLTAILGFVIGGVIGGVGGVALAGGMGALLGGLALGVLLAWLSFKLYKIGVFLVCFLAGALLGLLSGTAVVVALLGITIGVLGVIFTKPVIILATAVGGGMAMGIALGGMIGGAGMLLGIPCAIGGAILQFYMEKRKTPDGGQVAVRERPPRGVPTLAGNRGEGAFKQTLSEMKSGVLSAGQKVLHGTQSVVDSQAVQHLRGVITNTKTMRASPRQTVLVENSTPLWEKGVPIVLTAVHIVREETDRAVGLNLGFQNLGSQAVVGVFLSVSCYDLLKQELEKVDKFAIQDIRIVPGALWFSEQTVPLPDPNTRRCEIVVRNVVMADGTIWTGEAERPLSPIARQGALALEVELAKEFFLEARTQVADYNPETIYTYAPEQEEAYWNCACGQMNLGERCMACGVGRAFLFDAVDPTHLRAARETRIAQQKQMEEERRQKIAEQTQAVKEKAAAVGAQTAAAAQKGWGKLVLWCRQTIAKGKTLWLRVRERAQTVFREKVLPNRRKIFAVSGAAVLFVVLCVGGFFGFRHYQTVQAERAETARIQLEQEETARRQAEQARKAEEAQRKAEEERLRAEELATWEAQFIFAYSDKEPLTEADLEGLAAQELDYAKYEILARHGRTFSTPELAAYFATKSWYKGSVDGAAFDEGVLNETERSNVALIDAKRNTAGRARAAQAYLDVLYSMGWYASNTVLYTTATPPKGTQQTFPGIASERTFLSADCIDFDGNGTDELLAVWFEWASEPRMGMVGPVGYLRWTVWSFDGAKATAICSNGYRADLGDLLREFSLSVAEVDGGFCLYERSLFLGAMGKPEYFTYYTFDENTFRSEAYSTSVDATGKLCYFISTTEELTEAEFLEKTSAYDALNWSALCQNGVSEEVSITEVSVPGSPAAQLSALKQRLNATILAAPKRAALTLTPAQAQLYLDKIDFFQTTMVLIDTEDQDYTVTAPEAKKMLEAGELPLLDLRLFDFNNDGIPLLYVLYVTQVEDLQMLLTWELWKADGDQLVRTDTQVALGSGVGGGLLTSGYCALRDGEYMLMQYVEERTENHMGEYYYSGDYGNYQYSFRNDDWTNDGVPLSIGGTLNGIPVADGEESRDQRIADRIAGEPLFYCGFYGGNLEAATVYRGCGNSVQKTIDALTLAQ